MKKPTLKKFDPYDFSKKILDNVPVYYKNIPSSPCIHIKFCFNTGSLDDPIGLEGLSHFLEHMIFDGSSKIPNKKEIKEWSKIYALNSWNAWTWFSNTTYHLKCLPENFDRVLEGMKDMIFNPLLKESDIKHELSVITQEAWGRYKNEKYLDYSKEVLENIFHGTTRERISSPLGWPESILKIKQRDIKTWHKENYGKGNFFIVLVGLIENKHLEKIEKILKTVPIAVSIKNEFGKLQKPLKNIIEKNSEDIGDPQEQVEITFERTLETSNLENKEIINMSRSFLNDILFERMRTERALCYGVNVFAGFQKDFFQFGVNIKAKEENKEIILREFNKAIKDIITGKEIRRFKTLKKVNLDRLKSSEELTEEIADEALHYIWKYGKVWTKHESLNARQKVTYKDVSNFLKKVFDKKWMVTEILLPSKKK